jgi:exopolysaccharide biosynthesis polyprenyl glycosylphosphotransferase
MATVPITEDTIFLPPPSRPLVGRARKTHGWESRIMEEHHFIRMLCLERKRTERSGKPFMLMLIAKADLVQSSVGQATAYQIMQAVSASTRETDTLGWYEYGKTLAILFTEIGPPEVNAHLIIGKITTALQRVLGFEEFDSVRITFHVFPDRADKESKEADPDDLHLIFYPDSSAQQDSRRGARLFKRSVDVLGSLFLLAALWPAFLVIALMVRLTSQGPVLFRQNRVGQHGNYFTFLKFRSMYSNNDPKIHQEYVARLIEGKADRKQAGDGKTGVYKLTNDPRITPLGRFLRKTSLDELPQLLNVLIGNMSLVGPRPPVPYEFQRYDIWHRRRVLEVKPGITGLWQVMGRSKTTFDEMVRLDLKYAKAWSIWLDLKILLRTPMVVVLGDGAY